MKQRVYIETSIVSYLTARPSRDLIILARQQLTLDWWESQKFDYDVYISQLVLQEASAGDESAARRRLEALEDIDLLQISEEAFDLAQQLIGPGLVPEPYSDDAIHIATAVVNGIDYLLTWNFKHIGNAVLRNKFEPKVRSLGYEMPLICTPEELSNTPI